MKHITSALVILAAGIALAGCGASAGQQQTARPGAGSTSAGVSLPASPAKTSVQLVWSHTGKFFGETQVCYVARIANPGGSAASVALDARALDSSGTIIGSSQERLPDIPAHSQFDYYGYLGGGAFGAKLTGTPAKIEISQAPSPSGQAGAIQFPMLRTSEIALTAGSQDTDTGTAYSYDLTAKVTNTTRQELTGGVTQQVVLYDRAGHVVGGGTGASDNMPQTLPIGMSYRESWTSIPAVHPAARAAYTVWPAS